MNHIRIPKCDVRAASLLPGQVIWATDAFDLLPEGLYRVEEVTGEEVTLSVGKSLYARMPLSALIVLDTEVAEPDSWEECAARVIARTPGKALHQGLDLDLKKLAD